MRLASKTAILGAAGLTIAGAVIGNGIWTYATRKAFQRLGPAGSGADSSVFSEEMVKSLPLPVAEYFRFALKQG